MKRALVLADKAFEADGLMTVLESRHARPAFFPGEPVRGRTRGRRCHFEGRDVRVEVWCLEELVSDPNKLLTRNKIKSLQTLLWPEWDLVVSFATGGSPWAQRYGGSVVVGSAVLNHSPTFVTRKNGDLDQELDEVLACPGAAPFFTAFSTKKALDFERLLASRDPIDQKLAVVKKFLERKDGKPPEDVPPWAQGMVWNLVQRAEIEMKFVRPPKPVLEKPVLLFGKDWLAATSVNVERLEDVVRAEQESFEIARAACQKKRTLHEGPPTAFAVASLDTSHGLVRSYCGSAPFLFLSGLTQRPYSPIANKAREAQNYGAVFNAGIVAAYLVERILANPAILSPPEPKRKRRSRNG